MCCVSLSEKNLITLFYSLFMCSLSKTKLQAAVLAKTLFQQLVTLCQYQIQCETKIKSERKLAVIHYNASYYKFNFNRLQRLKVYSYMYVS